MQISLTGQLNTKVASGLYNDAAEVVRESLRFMQLHEEWIYQLKLEQLKNQLQIGIKQLDAGDSVNGRDFFQTLLKRYAKLSLITRCTRNSVSNCTSTSQKIRLSYST